MVTMLENLQKLLITLVVIMLVVPTAAGSATAEDSSFQQISNDEITITDDGKNITINESVHIWKQSVLPFRADPSESAATGVTKVQNLNGYVDIKSVNSGDVRVRKPTLAVYNAGSKVTLKLSGGVQGVDTEQFADKDMQLVVARLSPNESEARSWYDKDKLNETKNEAEDSNREDLIQRGMDLLTRENVNENVTFKVHDLEDSVSTEGALTTSFTPQKAGQYFVFLATPGKSSTGFSASDGNLSVDGEVTIIGMDAVTVQSEKAKVNVKDADLTEGSNSFELGDNVYFEANSRLDGKDNISHVMVLYKKDTFVNSRAEMTITGDIDENMTEDQVTVTHTLDYVKGHFRIRDENYGGTDEKNGWNEFGGEIRDIDFGDGKKVATLDLTDIAYSIADGVDNNTSRDIEVRDNVDSGSKVLDGSATVVVTASPKQFTGLRVGTLKNWEAGEYQWAYVAVGDEGKQLSTDSGTIKLKESSDDGGDGSDDEDDQDDGNDGNGNGGAPSSGGGGGGGGNIPSTLTDVTTKNGKATIAVTNVRKGSTVNIRFIAGQVANGVFEMDGIAINPGSDLAGFEMSVTPLDAVPSGVPAVDDEMPTQALSYFQIDHTISNDDINGVTYSFDVKKSSLNGQAPGNVVLYRYHEGSWSALSTRHVGQTGSSYEFEADSPGLSVYAIGVAQGDISVDNAELTSSTIKTGETAEVEVTVSNNGDGKATTTLKLTANGDTVSTQDVTLASGESKTLTLTHTFESAGDYGIAVNGVSAGTLTVEAADGSDDGDDSDGSDTSDESKDGGIPGAAWILIAIVLIAIGAGAVYYVREQQL